MTINYTALVSAVQNAFEETGSDFTAYIPTAIALAHRTLYRKLDTYGLVFNRKTTLVAGDPFLSMPTSAEIIKSLNYKKDNGQRVPILLRTDEYLQEYWPDRTSTGQPKYFAWFNRATLLLAPAPASANEVEMEYVAMPTVISASHPTNYYTDYCNDALFFSTMCEMCDFARHYEFKKVWEMKLDKVIPEAENTGRRERRDDHQEPGGPSENTKGGR